MMKFSEEVSAGGYSRELADAVARMILGALPGRGCASGQRAPFEHVTGDDHVGDVGPAMGWEDHEEYEQLRYGTPASGIAVRYVRQYYTSGRSDREDRGDEARIDSYGWGADELLLVRVRYSMYVRWQLPDDEHAALLAAWRAFKADRGMGDGWPGVAERM